MSKKRKTTKRKTAKAVAGTAKTKKPAGDRKTEAPGAAVAKDEKAKATGKAATKKVRSKKADGDLPAPRTTRQAGQKPKRVSALDAAAQVLKSAGKPMRTQELIAAMAEQNLWKSPGGATPWATLYAAIIREIGAKGDEARFKKADRGLFAFKGKGK